MITHLVITIPIIVWIMIGYFENIPMELEDAARIDGATRGRLPPCRAAAGTARHRGRRHPRLHLLLEQLHLLGGARRQEQPHAAFGRLQLLTFEQISWGPLAAAALLVTLPVLLVTVIAQRQIVAGLSAGGLKDG